MPRAREARTTNVRPVPEGVISGILSAAIVEGQPSAHLRDWILAGLQMKYPMQRLYENAATAALKARGLLAPGYEDVLAGKPGVVEKVGPPAADTRSLLEQLARELEITRRAKHEARL